MFHYQLQEILTFEGAVFSITSLAFNILESHLTILIGNNIFLANNTTVQIF